MKNIQEILAAMLTLIHEVIGKLHKLVNRHVSWHSSTGWPLYSLLHRH